MSDATDISDRPLGRVLNAHRMTSTLVGFLADWFAIKPSTAHVLLTLYRSKRSLTPSQLATRCGIQRSNVAVHLSLIRSALPDAVPYSGGWGLASEARHKLTDNAKLQIREAFGYLLGELATELADPEDKVHATIQLMWGMKYETLTI